MLKNILVLGVCGVFVFSCSKKDDVKDDEAKIAAVEVEMQESDISNVSASGSDYNQAGELESVNFEFDKSSITPEAKSVLRENFNWLKENPDVYIQIEGHCDERGTIEYNIALGERRAISVKNYLKQIGIKESRISTISYGEEKPLSLMNNEQGWAKNRRANFVIISR